MEEQKSKSNKESSAKLFRSRENKVIAGVCGGIAEYFNIDPLIIRISWIAAILFGGVGIIAYVIAIFIIPENTGQEANLKNTKITPERSKQWGILLIVIGTVLFLGQIGALHYLNIRHFHWQTFLALLLVSYGIYLIINRKGSSENEDVIDTETHNEKLFYRLAEGKMVSGVCSGIAEYFKMDVTIVRLILVFATLASGGLPIIVYLLAIMVFPYKQQDTHFEPKRGNS